MPQNNSLVIDMLLWIITYGYRVYCIAPNFLGQIIFVIFMRCKLITKNLTTKFFTPMDVSIGAAMNHEKCCL